MLSGLATQFLPRLREAYGRHLAQASPVSEAPVRAVLGWAVLSLGEEIRVARALVQRLAGTARGPERWKAWVGSSNGCWGALRTVSQVHGHLDTPTTMFVQPLRAENDASLHRESERPARIYRNARGEGRVRHILAKERIERDDEDLVRLYLTDIGQYPLLTKDDEVRLAQAIEAGRESEAAVAKAPKGLSTAKKREMRRAVMEGEQAQQTFVQSNLRLVVSIAKKYQASGLPLLDLIQEGNLGLMHAVEKFDWRKGLPAARHRDLAPRWRAVPRGGHRLGAARRAVPARGSRRAP